MRKLLNVLYITVPDTYLSLDGENVVIKKEEKVALRLPLHNLEQIVCFNYVGLARILTGACADRANKALCFHAPSGRFLARVTGKVRGNVLLRKKQYRVSDDDPESVKIAVWFLMGKSRTAGKWSNGLFATMPCW